MYTFNYVTVGIDLNEYFCDRPPLLMVWFDSLCFTSHRQQGYLETATPFTAVLTPFPPGIEHQAIAWNGHISGE